MICRSVIHAGGAPALCTEIKVHVFEIITFMAKFSCVNVVTLSVLRRGHLIVIPKNLSLPMSGYEANVHFRTKYNRQGSCLTVY